MSSKHSYVAFYMSDWIAGTAPMNRTMWSLYFQICLYNWDKARPMPENYLKIVTSDLPIEEVGSHLQWLIDEGKIELDEERGFFCRRALDEALKSYELWEKKSKGGKLSRQVIKNKGESSTLTKTPSNTPPIERKKEDKKERGKEQDIPPIPPLKKGGLNDVDDVDEKIAAEIAAFEAKSKALKRGNVEAVERVAVAWNEMAARHGLSQMSRMTDGRLEKLQARIADHGVDVLIETIAAIPQYPFLMGKSDNGWKANFDWLLRPDRCAKLIEGGYSTEEGGRESGWR